MNKVIDVDENGFIELCEFGEFVDVCRVVSYRIKLKKDGNVNIKFYDKKGKIVKPYVAK